MIKKKFFHIISSMEIIAGTENFLIRLLNENKEKFENYLILFSNKENLKNRLDKKINVKIFDLTNPITFFFNFFKLISFLKKSKPDLVFTWLYHANLLSIFIKIFSSKLKIYWNIRHSKIDKFNSIKSFFSFKMCQVFSSIIPKKIIYNSRFAKKVHEIAGYNKKNSLVIFNGVKKNKIIPNRKSKKIFFGMASRWHKDKNHENLFQSLNRLQNIDYSLVLCGKSVNSSNMKLLKLLKKYNIKKYYLLGELTNIDKYFKRIDINLLTSNTESFPNIILESMSYGIPSVATDVGDVKKIINDSGYVVKPNSPKSFSEALKKLVLEKKNKPKLWFLRRKKCHHLSRKNFDLNQTIYRFNKLA